MALDLTSGPYGTATYDEAFWTDMAQNWLKSGVIKSKLLEFLVFADSSGRQVKVRTGWAWVKGQFATHGTDNYVLPIVANSSGVTRFDYVILKNDWTANKITLTTKEGSAGVLPTLQDDAAAFEMALASVIVANGAVTLAADRVTDQRAFSAPGPVRIHATGVTSNPAVGTTAAAIPEMVLPIVTRGGDIEVRFSGAAFNSLAGGTSQFSAQLDAGALDGIGAFGPAGATVTLFVGGTRRFLSVAPGRHTVTIWAQASAGTLTMLFTHRTITVEEVW